MYGKGSLEESLDSFTSSEIIESVKPCDGCHRIVEGTKRFFLDELPNVAVIQLKRFINVGNISEKIDTHLPFPRELDLVSYTS